MNIELTTGVFFDTSKPYKDQTDQVRDAVGEITSTTMPNMDWEHEPGGSRRRISRATFNCIGGKLQLILNYKNPIEHKAHKALMTSTFTVEPDA